MRCHETVEAFSNRVQDSSPSLSRRDDEKARYLASDSRVCVYGMERVVRRHRLQPPHRQETPTSGPLVELNLLLKETDKQSLKLKYPLQASRRAPSAACAWRSSLLVEAQAESFS